MRGSLLDTGPLVAYLNGSDPANVRVSELFDSFTGQLFTTSAVITEAMYFVSASTAGPRLLSEFVVASGMLIHDLSQPEDLNRAVALMEKYADTPMDYADATLLLLAEQIKIFDILTLDRRGFSTYRTTNGKSLQQLLEQAG